MTDRPPPSEFTTGYAFVALMTTAGMLLGFLFRANPALGDATVGLIGLLALSLIFDIVVNRLAGQGKVAPLTMPWRLGGFLGGMLLHIGLLAAAGG